jgi:hypothetical protein
MDAAKLDQRIYGGYAKAAQRIGYESKLYRPSFSAEPLNEVNHIRSIFTSYNAEDMRYGKAQKYGKAVWFGLFDGRLTQVGDYLKNDKDGTFFIASQDTALPILVVKCDRIATILRPQQQSGVGALGYGGNTDAGETELMTDWPCSILIESRGDRGVNLPGDVRDPWWTILLPKYESAGLRSGDIVKDDLDRRYVINSAELSGMGWRITAAQAQT